MKPIVLYETSIMQQVKTICICGAGTMGSGIAQVAAMAGYTTILFDLQPAMLEKSRAAIEKSLQWLLEKEKISTLEKKECIERLLFTDQLNDCVADLVIEAIIEKEAAKVDLFNQLSAINPVTTIFATNTSSIAVSSIATAVPVPKRVVGMHFFNPAVMMKLVEIISTDFTADETVATIATVAGTMRKTAVFCKDSPGFIVNRVARHYYLEAMKLVAEGYAGIETVDEILQATGFKMGPFKLMDLIGMDINFDVSKIVWNALGKPERLTPSPLQERKVLAGELGRKTGRGFYSYDQ